MGVAIFAPWIALTDPVMDANLMNAELPPSWEFPFGTDAQGRDIFSRICYGARISLTVGVVSQICNSLIGVTLGLTAGYWGGWWDDLVSGLTNLMLAIPSLVFALAIMAILGPGLVSLVIALGLTSWSYSCRIARAQVLSLKSQGYVQAARILGYGDLRIMFTQVLPNILGPLIVIATLGMGGAILAEAALSFLGLGIRPPFPSWGSMLSEARDQIRAGAVAVGVPRPRHLLHRARPQPSGRRAARHPRPAVRDHARRMSAPLLKVDDLHIALAGDGVDLQRRRERVVRDRPRRGVRAGGRIGLRQEHHGARHHGPAAPAAVAGPAAASCSTARRSRTHRPPRCAGCAASASP